MFHYSKCMRYLRPRERLQKLSIEALSDHELLQLMIGSGNRQADVGQLARRVLKVQRRLQRPPSFDALVAIEGLGPALAARLTASFEYSRRLLHSDRVSLQGKLLSVQYFDGKGTMIHSENTHLYQSPYQSILTTARRYRAGSVKISSPMLLQDAEVQGISKQLQQQGLHTMYSLSEEIAI